eukprot:SAG22_NODE_262_length_13373_cov_11.716965_6_plen_111_part_00
MVLLAFGLVGLAGISDAKGGTASAPGLDAGLPTAAGAADGGSKYAEIHLAVTRGNIEKLTELLADGVDVDLRTEEGFTTLHIAVARSQPNIVRLLLEVGQEPQQAPPLPR